MAYHPPVNGARINASLSGNTAGALQLVSTGTLYLAGGNNITLSQNGQSITISGGTAVGTGGGFQSAGMSNLGNTSGTTGMAASTLYLAGGNNVTLSQSVELGNATVTVSTPNMFNAGVSTAGNTAGSTGTQSNQMVLVGGNSITLSQSTGANGATVTIVGPTVAAPLSFYGGVSTGGNTSGTTGTVNQGIVFVGGNNVTLSQSTAGPGGGSATITISAGAGGAGATFSGGMSNIGNTSGTSGTVSGQLVLAGGNNVTLSQSVDGASATVTISAGAGGAGQTLSGYQPFANATMAVGQLGQGSLFLHPFELPSAVQMDRVLIPVNFSGATNSTGQYTASLRVGLYTKNASTLSLAYSTSLAHQWTHSGTANSASNVGWRNISIAWTTTITGNNYVMGFVSSTSSSSANASISNFRLTHINSVFSGNFGVASNNSAQFILGRGRLSVTTNGMPASIAYTNVQGGSLAYMQPQVIAFTSGTA